MDADGEGVPQGYKESLRWFHKAAEGDVGARILIGAMYCVSKGCFQDYKEALRWYGKAADQVYADAQFCIGGMYADGEGMP
jgi:TPR repeat protein